MIEISSGLEGELLIRSILYNETEAVSHDVLRVHADAMPCPSVPQIVARSGFDRLAIVTDDGSAAAVPRLFLWQGIDGTRIETSIHSAVGGIEHPAVGETAAPPKDWYGELAEIETANDRTDDIMLWDRARALQHNEFLGVTCGQDHLPHSLLHAAWMSLLSDASGPRQPMSDEETLMRVRLASGAARAEHELGESIDTRGMKHPVIVINDHSFYSNEAVSVPLYGGVTPITAIGPEGEAEQVQILQDPDGDGRNFALFIARNAPLHGYAVWDLGATVVPAESDDEVSVSRTHLENALLRVDFDAATGLILKIFDKENDRDVLNETFEVQRSGKRDLLLESCANLFEVFDISGASPAEKALQLDGVDVTESGPVRGAICFRRTLPGGRSTVRQTVRLTARSARIDFVTEIDWQDEDRLLTVSFPVAINSGLATYEIPFGIVERPTYHNGNSKRHGAPGSCWADLSEGDYGVAMLHDGGYTCDVRENNIRLTLPCPNLYRFDDVEPYRVTYSLLPHGGNPRDGEVVESSRAFCRPPECLSIKGNTPGSLPLERSFFEVDSASIFFSAIKRAEKEENAVTVRLYEAHNTRGTVLLITTLPVKTAWLCDLLENNLVEIPLDNGELLLPFHPFEIITVKYTL